MSEAAEGMVTGEVQAPAAGEEQTVQNQETGAKGKVDQVRGDGKEVKETPAERLARYKALVGPGGEFADLYQAETQKAVKGRLAEAKKAMAAQQPVLDMLMTRYGTQDMAQLQAALEADAGWWRSYADERGITEAQARQQLTMQAELDAMRRRSAQEEGERRMAAQMEVWGRQAREVQAAYPEFDLDAAMASGDFKAMLRAGVDMKTAYEVVHMDDIKVAVARAAAKDAETRVTDNIRAKGARPAEGGASGQVGASVKADPGRMSGKEILDVAARAARGETIVFS